MTFDELEELSRRIGEPGGFREVFEDAVREMTREDLDALGVWIADRLRGPSRIDAANALITWSQVLSALELPNPVPTHAIGTAYRVLEENREFYPESRLTTLTVEADRLERFLPAVRWLEDLRNHPRRAEPPGADVQVYKNGRLVGRSRNLAGVTNYARRAQGATLIVLEHRPGRFPDGEGLLHIYFDDGATLSTSFSSYEHMERWLSNKLRARRSWLAGAPIAYIHSDAAPGAGPPPEIERDLPI